MVSAACCWRKADDEEEGEGKNFEGGKTDSINERGGKEDEKNAEILGLDCRSSGKTPH